MLSDNIERLYDVQSDPGESNDRALADPTVASELREAFRKWNAQLPKPRKATRSVTTEYNGDKIEWGI